MITGGGAKLPKIVELAKDKISLPSSLGKPRGISGLNEDLSFATVGGLVLLGADTEEKEPAISGFGKDFLAKAKKILKIFIP